MTIAKGVLAKIHIARKQLGMDEDTYRAMLRSVGGVQTAKALTPRAATRVLQHLERSGAVYTRSSTPAPDTHPASSKIRALWLDLHARGVVRDASERALLAYVKRMTGIDRLEWIDGRQAARVIEALKNWVKRVEATS